MKNSLPILIILSLIYLQVIAQNPDLWIWPRPTNYTFGNQIIEIKDPSNIIYHVKTNNGERIPDYIRELISFYHKKIFYSSDSQKKYKNKIQEEDIQINIFSYNNNIKNRYLQSGPIVFNIQITNMSLVTPLTVQDEQYFLQFLSYSNWNLTTNTYSGFVRAMETYSELIQHTGTAPLYQYYMNNTPITINDLPAFPHRGIMIDTARHYLSMEVIFQTLDAMMYNKLNVLHWHITDAESFPLVLNTYPNITNYGAYTSEEIYTKQMVADVILYAKKRGIRVIPEIDSPGHATSWGRSPQFSNIALLCGRYNGQLDPTINLTYQAVQGILKDMNDYFEDSIVHLGGDEVQQSCWDQRPSIKQFMNQNNIANYTMLEYYYRQQEKAIWRNISKTKNVTYWVNGPTQVDPDDIIDWWGYTDLSAIQNLPNQIILSTYNNTYLDVGFGNLYGGDYGQMYTWLKVYSFNPIYTNISGTIIGGEASLWSEVNNDQTQSQKLWMRASSFSERLWNPNANVSSTTVNLVQRLQAQKQRMQERGLSVSPITSEYCERNIYICFNGR